LVRGAAGCGISRFLTFPTIGKTVFLFYLVLALIMDAQRFAIQWTHDFYYVVKGPEDVQIHSLNPAEVDAVEDMWALSDSNADVGVPASVFTTLRSSCYLVQTSSPKSERWKEWRKQREAGIMAMESFRWDEMYFVGYL